MSDEMYEKLIKNNPLDDAMKDADRKRDLFLMPVHVLYFEDTGYYSVIDMNLHIYIDNPLFPDKKIYYTAKC